MHFGNKNKNGRGIKSGTGICSCDDEACSCIADVFRQQGNNNGAKEERQSSRKLSDRENEVLVSGARKGGHALLLLDTINFNIRRSLIEPGSILVYSCNH